MKFSIDLLNGCIWSCKELRENLSAFTENKKWRQKQGRGSLLWNQVHRARSSVWHRATQKYLKNKVPKSTSKTALYN